MDIRDYLKHIEHIRSEVKASFGDNLAFDVSNEGDSLEILVHGVIGEELDGLDSVSVVAAIKQFGGPAINLDISTPGGSVLDALAVYAALDASPATVTANITGGAMSAGTIIASGADNIRIGESASYMIHNAWTIAVGDADIMEQAAEELRRSNQQIASLLAARSGQDVAEVARMMAAGAGNSGTTFVGAEAVEAGFADEVVKLKEKKKPGKMRAAPKRSAAALRREVLRALTDGA
jgi:ATP-dependent Clp protease protease subunit